MLSEARSTSPLDDAVRLIGRRMDVLRACCQGNSSLITAVIDFLMNQIAQKQWVEFGILVPIFFTFSVQLVTISLILIGLLITRCILRCVSKKLFCRISAVTLQNLNWFSNSFTARKKIIISNKTFKNAHYTLNM